MLSTTVTIEKKLVENKSTEKASIKPLSLSPMQKKAQDFAAQCKEIEVEWQEHLCSVAKAKAIFTDKYRAYRDFQNSAMVPEFIVEEYNQALIKWHDRIDMIRESIYADEREANKLFNTPGSDPDSKLARELSIKMRDIIETRREKLRKYQNEVDQHAIILFESLENTAEASPSTWTSWLWKKLAPKDLQPSAEPNTTPTMKA